MNLIDLKNFKRFSEIVVDVKEEGLTLISGVNNSGKTSMLHALAVWEYAKILLINFRGIESLAEEYDESKKGLGIAPESFSPISIPSLKYLWKDQKTNGSYGLKIKVGWKGEDDRDLFLEIAYSLNGNNFAIKKSSSNLVNGEKIPTIAYLPPFGGMDENESWLSVADRRKLIGKGQAGSVIRNLLLDLHIAHEQKIQQERDRLFAGRRRLNTPDKDILDSIETEWRVLKGILGEVFHVNLYVHPFDSKFHNYIHIDVVDLVRNGDTNQKGRDLTSKRDLMVEGSGFLQWLSVFAMALDQNNNILLLDEPDAHLHSSLQSLLLEKLEGICTRNNKQILMVSHSSDLIKLLDYEKILHVENSAAKYLDNVEQKVLVLEGLGSKYFPLLDGITEHKNILMVENDSDARILKYLCDCMGKEWPKNLVIWPTNKKHKERKTLILELNQKIMQETGSPIRAYSLMDLDDQNYSHTSENLHDGGKNHQYDDSGQHIIMYYRTLRRREVENYLIIPSAISRYIAEKSRNADVTTGEAAVNDYLMSAHALVIHDNFKDSDRADNTAPLFTVDPKPILRGINRHFRVKFKKEEYVQKIQDDEVCDDLRLVVDEIIAMCQLEA